jgi:hypothetical protein
MTDETIQCTEPTPRVAVARDQKGNLFEAYELRRCGQSIFVDVRFVELVQGGIESVHQAISPHFMIVMETLK